MQSDGWMLGSAGKVCWEIVLEGLMKIKNLQSLLNKNLAKLAKQKVSKACETKFRQSLLNKKVCLNLAKLVRQKFNKAC